jgi:hypothetical protein
MYVFNIPYLYVLYFLNTLRNIKWFENNVIICWYIIFYELFVLNFIIQMYYVMPKKSYFKKNLSFGQSMKKKMIV